MKLFYFFKYPPHCYTFCAFETWACFIWTNIYLTSGMVEKHEATSIHNVTLCIVTSLVICGQRSVKYWQWFWVCFQDYLQPQSLQPRTASQRATTCGRWWNGQCPSCLNFILKVKYQGFLFRFVSFCFFLVFLLKFSRRMSTPTSGTRL